MADPAAPIPVLATMLDNTGFAPSAFKTSFAELDKAPSPVLRDIFCNTVNGSAPFATDVEALTKALAI